MSSSSTCMYITLMALFNRSQLIQVCTNVITVRTDPLCWQDLSSWEVNVTVQCGLVIVNLITKMLKCQWICFFHLVFPELFSVVAIFPVSTVNLPTISGSSSTNLEFSILSWELITTSQETQSWQVTTSPTENHGFNLNVFKRWFAPLSLNAMPKFTISIPHSTKLTLKVYH